jgi:hypoxanthine-DNA glycosylase
MRAFFMGSKMKIEQTMETPGLAHPFAPVFDARSEALVLGSFPSVKSRENAFYYGHPQNRFWRLLAALFSDKVPETISDKKDFLLMRRIALWDAVQTCTIAGSADSAISAQSYSDITALLQKTGIRSIFANGQTAGKLYRSHLEMDTGLPILILPSTSPANAAWPLSRLLTGWQPLFDALRSSDGESSQHLSNRGLAP